jgi:hypothetical protein
VEDHNGVLMMQRVLLAGTLGLAMARKAAAILEGEPNRGDGAAVSTDREAQAATAPGNGGAAPDASSSQDARASEGAVLRAILDAANECLGHFDDRPAGERWCDTLFRLLDLAAFAAELG